MLSRVRGLLVEWVPISRVLNRRDKPGGSPAALRGYLREKCCCVAGSDLRIG
jgi:hypothetical protein